MTESFAERLLQWFEKNGRKNLPWQHPRSPYHVWISEIMLQQTQVQTVIPFFERFIKTFPTISQLSAAEEDTVLAHWSGLGYYSRARNIHRTAKLIQTRFDGEFPDTLEALQSLPGIGPTTAAAIASLAFNQMTPILDGNVIRVLSRYFRVEGWHGLSAVKKKLWQLAASCMVTNQPADYTQAIMDLGASCCTQSKPACTLCPLQETCLSYLNNCVEQHPFKKPKTLRPTRQEQFLLLYKPENMIYLEKRPSKGIWGGLWCLPAISLEEDPKAHVLKHYSFHCKKVEKLLHIKHSFTHFHLEITALAMKMEAIEEKNPGQWFSASCLNQIGMAAPVNQIIRHFFDKQTNRF